MFFKRKQITVEHKSQRHPHVDDESANQPSARRKCLSNQTRDIFIFKAAGLQPCPVST